MCSRVLSVNMPRCKELNQKNQLTQRDPWVSLLLILFLFIDLFSKFNAFNFIFVLLFIFKV